MNEQSEESNDSSIQANSKNNYKYDNYGFILVNSIEDLLYDKFNCYMENYINIKNSEKNKNKLYINKNRNLTSKISTRNKINLNLSKNKDKKKKFINKYSIKDKNEYNNSNKYIEEYSSGKNEEEFTFCENDTKNKNSIKIIKNKESINNSEENNNEEFFYNLPIVSPCLISKILRYNDYNKNNKSHKSKRVVMIKKCNLEIKFNEQNDKILKLPKSNICYFKRKYRIINISNNILLQNKINKNSFGSKEINNYKNNKKVDIITQKLKSYKRNNSKKNKLLPIKNKLINKSFLIKSKPIKIEKEKEEKNKENISLNKTKIILDKLNKNTQIKKNSEGYHVSVRTKFKKNQMLNNTNKILNYNIYKKNNIYPPIKKLSDESSKNKSISYINDKDINNYNNDETIFFPAINSYFH